MSDREEQSDRKVAEAIASLDRLGDAVPKFTAALLARFQQIEVRLQRLEARQGEGDDK